MSKRMIYLAWTIVPATALTLSLSFTQSTQATTPDGETPAVETVCDPLEDDAAWGLCNAYCEAMDCDSDDPQASDRACQKVLERYETVTEEPIPCAPAPLLNCPCFNQFTEAQLVETMNVHPIGVPICSGNENFAKAEDLIDGTPILRARVSSPLCQLRTDTLNLFFNNTTMDDEDGATCVAEASAIISQITWCPEPL